MTTRLIPLLIFLALTVLALAASVHAWRTHQRYGLMRFCAFETLAVLVAWNADVWFHNPFSPQQIVSWLLFLISLLLAIHGVYLLVAIGKAQKRIMEEARRLVETGAYKYIRHPLYASLILFSWGVFFKGLDPASGLLAVGVTAFLTLTARYEERYNREYFGSAYVEYMKHTKMFLPFFFSL